MARLSSELVLSLIDRVTGPARAVAANMRNLQDRLARNNQQMDALRGRMFDAVTAAAAMAGAVALPVKAAIEFESAMADVRKVVDFPTPKSFVQMGKDIRQMSLEIPMAADGLAAIVAAAGQSGLDRAELLPFAEMAAKVGVAWEVSADQAGDALAKLKTALGLSVADTGLLADAINHLGNNTASNAPDILDMVRRVAGSAKQFGFTAEQASAFGAAMIGSGFESEVAATSFLNMGRALTRGASATERQREALGKLGLDSVKVSKNMQKNAVGTVREVLKRLAQLPAHMRASVMSDFFGDEARALTPLITNAENLDKALALVSSQTEYAGSAAEEYGVRSQTTANAMQLFRNRVTDLGISIGDALLPGLNQMMATLGPIITSFSELAQRFPRLTAAVVALAASLVTLRIAAIAAQFAFLWMKGGALMAGIAGMKTFGAAAGAVAGGLGILGGASRASAQASKAAAAAAVEQAAALLSQRQAAYQTARSVQALAEKGKVAGTNLAQATANVKATGAALVAAQADMKVANAAMAATAVQAGFLTRAFRIMRLALIGTGIGAALVAIAAAGTWIYNNWQGITTAFEAFKGAFARAVEPVMPMLQPVIDGASSLWEKISELLGPVDQMGGSWTAWGIAAGEAVGAIVVLVAELPARIVAFVADMVAAGASLMNGLLEGIKAGAVAVIDAVKGIGASIRDSVSGAASGAWSSVKGMVGLGGGTAAVAIDDTKAVGGAIAAGRTYLVGEEGPELITPSRSGWVHTAGETAGMMASPKPAGTPIAAGSAPSINLGGIAIHAAPGMDEATVARLAADEVSRRIRELFSAGQFDSGWRVA